jgi:aspartyl-tRNA(Asn)/glutamyl-tRNA(Gln) amidotransferase subunit B
MSDTSAVDAAIEAVITANPDKVEELKTKPKLAAWFVGQVMRHTDGKANPMSVYTALKQRLNLPDDG